MCVAFLPFVRDDDGAFQNVALSSNVALDSLLEAGDTKFLSQSRLGSIIT